MRRWDKIAKSKGDNITPQYPNRVETPYIQPKAISVIEPVEDYGEGNRITPAFNRDLIEISGDINHSQPIEPYEEYDNPEINPEKLTAGQVKFCLGGLSVEENYTDFSFSFVDHKMPEPEIRSLCETLVDKGVLCHSEYNATDYNFNRNFFISLNFCRTCWKILNHKVDAKTNPYKGVYEKIETSEEEVIECVQKLNSMTDGQFWLNWFLERHKGIYDPSQEYEESQDSQHN